MTTTIPHPPGIDRDLTGDRTATYYEVLRLVELYELPAPEKISMQPGHGDARILSIGLESPADALQWLQALDLPADVCTHLPSDGSAPRTSVYDDGRNWLWGWSLQLHAHTDATPEEIAAAGLQWPPAEQLAAALLTPDAPELPAVAA